VADESPTVLDTPASKVTPASGAGEPTTTQLPSPETVLHTAEIEQTRRMAITGVLFNIVGVASWPFIGGDPTAKIIATASLAGAALNNAWLWYVASDARRYNQRRVIAYFIVSPILNTGIIYFLGVFGPVVVMFVLNVYMACLGYDRRVALVTLVGCIAPYVLLAGPITLGWIPDPGLMTATPYIGTVGRAIVVVSLAVFLCLVYSQARRTRELMVASLVQRDDAVRKASHREALFLEARQDLERALQAGGLGRFTDQTLGSYKLGAVLGRGGMGEVYEALHVGSGERAAVKMLLPEVLTRPNYVRRFLREVQIASSLDSPHVVRVLEVGDEAAPLPYLAMERLEGEDLAQILRREERLTPARVVDMVRQVGRGLTAAKGAGIVHRDLKPQNLFLTTGDEPIWKILDFGVSKLMDQSGTLTQGDAVGTPQYMAPEQARGAKVGPRADLYGLGAIAYRALTGHQPFPGRDIGEVMLSAMWAMPVRPTALASLHRDVDLVLAIAMAKDPDDRFDSGEEFASALEAAIADRLDGARRSAALDLIDALPWTEPGVLPRKRRAKRRR
jgi:serine/threonine-protein kinase